MDVLANSTLTGVEFIEENGGLANRSGNDLQPQNESPGALAGATGAMQNELAFEASIYRIKADKAIALCRAIKECDRDYAFEIMATALSNMQTNGPSFDPFSDLRQDAEFWADIASAVEVEAYTIAGLRRLGTAIFGLNLRKRVFAALWEGFPEPDRKAFLSRVDPTGQFVRAVK